MFKKIILSALVFTLIAFASYNLSVSENRKFSSLELLNIEALGSNENGGYSCTVSLNCCGTKSNVTVSCSGVNKCEVLKDAWGYSCRGVKCDGKETSC